MKKNIASNLWCNLIKRLWRAPDKPYQVFPNYLPNLEGKNYIAESKYDGFRAVILIDSKGATAYSRHFKPMNINTKILKMCKDLGFPSGTALDAEWMGRRASHPECVYLLDILYHDWQWQGNKTLVERLSFFEDLKLSDWILRPQSVSCGFLDFFESQIGDPNNSPTEGIVLKSLNSKLIGNPICSRENPLWCKVKWRAGPDGKQIIYKKSVFNHQQRK